jgi:ubiquinone/menaquinone biosynthesis C-methylase UbiE
VQSGMSEIDLDRLARAYELRPMSEAARARAVVSANGCTGWLLDIGGGLGRHAAMWDGHGQHPVVVDPSVAMLHGASTQNHVSVVQGRSQNLPFGNGVAALAYLHLSIHYGDWHKAIDEALRVVAPLGRVEIWTITPEAIARSSLGQWFPKVVEIDTERFPHPESMAQYLRTKGYLVEVSRADEPIARRVGDWMDAVRGRFVSTLQLLDDDEIDAGLTRFAEQHSDRDEIYRYKLGLTRITTHVR